MAALSPNSLVSTPVQVNVQVNQQVKANLQSTVSQVAQDTQKAAKSAQTDTVTISAQALKMTDDKNVVAQKAENKTDDQKALQVAADTTAATKNDTQKNAVKAYAAVSANK